MGDGSSSQHIKAAPRVTFPDDEATTGSGVVPKMWDDDPEMTRTTPTWMGVTKDRAPAKHAALVVMTGIAAGRILSIRQRKVTVGRSKQADINLGDEGVSRMHCGIARQGKAHILSDLGSTHGTLVNGERADNIELKTGDLIQIGPRVVAQFAIFDDGGDELANKLYVGATRDLVTQALNRRALSERLESEAAYAVRHGTKLAAFAIAIDPPDAALADALGGAGQDAVLREVAATIASSLRSEDVFARTGDVAFVVLTRDLAACEGFSLAERIRARVEMLAISFGGRTVKVTLSAGMAELKECATAESLLKLAEERLESAQRSGRNRVTAVTL